MKQSGKGSKGNGKSSEVRKDKKSGTGMSGSPKKGGHGGKFTWAGDGLFAAEIGDVVQVVDVKDPNFEDPDEAPTV
ncbi:phosphoinositide 3-kinase regulatory subunit 4-like [Hibiscus syriacus]|uniref:Phosphoinositide 3-kinase regulatory subunit 4-like n=1 Tax=Hibiscus syriacus TaxID=106335 RepID=A0A6A3APY2_HIBSY|nr:phosphoinositide 3-kinase regulatory subunit 4-like [Hibiscus syriacus]